MTTEEPSACNGSEHQTVPEPCEPEEQNGTAEQDHEAPESEKQCPEASLKRKRERTPLPEGMSRSAYKRQKRQALWDAERTERRAKKREKEKAAKVAKREAIAAGELPRMPKPAQRKGHGKPVTVPVTFVIDCSFDDLMTEIEIKSLSSQITRCYSDNSHGPFKAHLAISSFGGRLKERFDVALHKHHENWSGVRFFGDDFVAVAEKARVFMADIKQGGKLAGALTTTTGTEERTEMGGNDSDDAEVVYLSSESDNILDRLKPHGTYIIGGLVDRNRHKGICYKRACDRGIKTARLPIGEFLELSTRKVLTTNHVNEIMLRWLESGDWGDAFMKVIPKRKGVALKSSGEGNEHDDSQADLDEVPEVEENGTTSEAVDPKEHGASRDGEGAEGHGAVKGGSDEKAYAEPTTQRQEQKERTEVGAV